MISLHVDIHDLVDFYYYIVHTAVLLYMHIFTSTLNNEQENFLVSFDILFSLSISRLFSTAFQADENLLFKHSQNNYQI